MNPVDQFIDIGRKEVVDEKHRASYLRSVWTAFINSREDSRREAIRRFAIAIGSIFPHVSFDECDKILKMKAKDYVGNKAFDTCFKTQADELRCDVWTVWRVLVGKHIHALINLLDSDSQPAAEPIYSRVNDVRNYLVILWRML